MSEPALTRAGRARSIRWSAAACSIVVTALVAVAGPVLAQPSEPAEPRLPPIDVVVLVDESESLTPPDVDREKSAARTIAGGILAPGSTIEVVGFASADGPGQSAVDLVCPRTPLDTPAQADAVAVCIEKLRIRAADEGNDTDHVTAPSRPTARCATRRTTRRSCS